jgi:NAD(P)-dependent dehydrogenase (short-subunit alcohol dehydrogenase family)
MLALENKHILVVGQGGRGAAACEFLRRSGATIVGVDHAKSHGEASERIRAAWSLFYSLQHRGFVARSSGRNGEKCDFRRRSFACTGLFELGPVSKPSASR